MLKTDRQKNGPRSERGGVLVTVLIVATVFAVLAYITLQVSLQSLESTDTHRNVYTARMVAEGGLEHATARLRQEFASGLDMDPFYMEPSYALSTSEDSLRLDLIDSNMTTVRELDSFPITYERTAYTVDSGVVSTHSDDTTLISGSREDATYRYLDDTTFTEDYPGYEFAPVHSDGDLIVYGVGEVIEPEGDTTVFSFLRGQYHNVQWNYDVREAGVTEPSRLGPYPLIETEHTPYGSDQSRMWTVTYQQDPRNPGRHITDIRLMADISPDPEVQISLNDWLYVSGWIEQHKRFQGLDPLDPPELQILEGNKFTDYTNAGTEVFTVTNDGPMSTLPELNATTLGLFWMSDSLPPVPGQDFGFRINGIRYGFDSDSEYAVYGTPHPYDFNVPQTTSTQLNLQVIYSPFQAQPATAEYYNQRMRIQFSEEFSLDDNDVLFLFNATEPNAAMAVQRFDIMNLLPMDRYSVEIQRPLVGLGEYPLAFILLLARPTGGDSDGVLNYGYEIEAIEYTDRYGQWVRTEEVFMESPHTQNLARNDMMFNIPADPVLPPLMVPGSYAGYQTLCRPFCPNTDDPTGIGTVDEWFVKFGDGCNLMPGAANNDFIRVTTPGNTLVVDPRTAIPTPYETIFFVHPDGGLGDRIYDPYGIPDPLESVQYKPIEQLNYYIVNCGTAEICEIEFSSDDVDQYDSSMENFGYRVHAVEYTTSDGADDDRTPPTIRSDVYFPSNESYPAFGALPYEYSEWWYHNEEALLVGLHFDRYHFDLDPGDRLEIYDEDGILIATLVDDSVTGGPDTGTPGNPDLPGGGEQEGKDPHAGGPYFAGGTNIETIVDLDATYGWVLIPGTTAQVKLIGDGDDNEGFAGFEIDHCGFVNGDLNEIRDYVTDYTELAYDIYFDRSAEAMEAFRTLGID